MDRRDRDHYDRNDYGLDYSRYEGYSKDDEHYHSARNLTNKFERDYQRERGYGDEYSDRGRREHTYHEGNMGGAYEQYRRDEGGFRDPDKHQWDRYDRDRNYSHDYDRERDYSSNYDRDRNSNYRSNQDMNWGDRDNDRYRNQEQQGNRRQGYLTSYYDGTFGSRRDLDSDSRRGSMNDQSSYYSGSGVGYGKSRYNDRSYSGGTSYSGNYGRDRDKTYSRDSRHEDNWYSSGNRRDELNRYY
ncbi:hypothetical protein ACFSRY_00170 [Pontibacter locisalis]|uniref:Uncharacterized protein n=1 Tax=Pontibacter locisalis TaxID=1719035 RepID=A0ABW5IGZ3_9BACT